MEAPKVLWIVMDEYGDYEVHEEKEEAVANMDSDCLLLEMKQVKVYKTGGLVEVKIEREKKKKSSN